MECLLVVVFTEVKEHRKDNEKKLDME